MRRLSLDRAPPCTRRELEDLARLQSAAWRADPLNVIPGRQDPQLAMGMVLARQRLERGAWCG